MTSSAADQIALNQWQPRIYQYPPGLRFVTSIGGV